MEKPRVTILGVGNILLTDEGFGVHVVHKMGREYRFPDNVNLIDGNVLGLSLLGVISEADHLIVVDAIKNSGAPGTFYRIEGEEIPRRILAKNSLHQVDLLEALTLSQALDHVPETVILGVEPKDIQTLSTRMTPEADEKIDHAVMMVLSELTRLGIPYEKGAPDNVSCNPFEDS